MAETRYIIWLQIEEQVDADEGYVECTDIGEPEPLEVEFDSPEAAERMRTMMLGVVDRISDYMVAEATAPTQWPLRVAGKQPDPFIFGVEQHERETSSGEAVPEGARSPVDDSSGSKGHPGPAGQAADLGAEGEGLSGAASGHPEAELTAGEQDFLDSKAEDSAGVEYFHAGRLNRGREGTHRR